MCSVPICAYWEMTSCRCYTAMYSFCFKRFGWPTVEMNYSSPVSNEICSWNKIQTIQQPAHSWVSLTSYYLSPVFSQSSRESPMKITKWWIARYGFKTKIKLITKAAHITKKHKYLYMYLQFILKPRFLWEYVY